MASLCKRQQCTTERRGFRQELDSWRHKLKHCVGFESILEGRFGPELIEDLKLFKDCEPVAVCDWSFDENCPFCWLRRNKVKEHLLDLSSGNLEDTFKPLLAKDQTAIDRLEKQAEEFLNAVLRRKDVPSFSEPHIPGVAQEILQKMIQTFAVAYTSKASPPQDFCSDPQFCSDQSLPPEPSGASPSTSPVAMLSSSANDQNPVLIKLLMADQDAPLDLTMKKPLAEPSEQEGVLDLSLKRNRYSSSLPVHSSYLSPPTPMLKGEPSDVLVAKAKDLQSTSTLEQFMAKLCRHHQRQIVDAIGFLQTEVKALGSSNTTQASNSTCLIQGITAPTTEKKCPKLMFPNASSHQSRSEVHDMSLVLPSSCKTLPLKTSNIAGPPLDLCRLESESIHGLVTSTPNFEHTEKNHHADHAPLKMKIMKTSNLADGKKLSCVLATSLSSHAGIEEDTQSSSNSSNLTEAHSARLSSSVKRHNQPSNTYSPRMKETLTHAKDSTVKLFSVHMTIPSDPPRTARKTIRASSACRVPIDPDVGHCDIVYIDKPITECLKEQQRNMLPRRNARKSTRGHMYVEEMWELKTVRTLAGRNDRGNCPNPMPDLITLVTPKQMLSKPDSVPPVDMPFAGGCSKKIHQQMPTEESGERVIPGTGDMGEVAASEIDVLVETSQTDQCQTKSAPQSPLSSLTEERETVINAEEVQGATTDSAMTTQSEESVAHTPFVAGKDDNCESREDVHEITDQVVTETTVEPTEHNEIDECKLSSADTRNGECIQEKGNISETCEINNVGEELKVIEDEQPQEVLSETQTHHDNLGVTENIMGSAEESLAKIQEISTVETVDHLTPMETQLDDDDDNDKYDVSSKTLEALLKELPPWRRKRGTVISLPKRLRQTKTVVVGYVNGRPISASDRSLRRRLGNSTTTPSKSLVKSSQNIPKSTSVDASVEKRNLTKDLCELHTLVKSVENTTLRPKAEGPSPDTPSIPISKSSSSTKELQKQVQREDGLPTLCEQSLDSPQSPGSKHYLRSAKNKPTGTCTSTPNVNAASFAASARATATPALPAAGHFPSPPFCSSAFSPTRIRGASPPAVSEENQIGSVSGTSVELNAEQPQAADTNLNEKQISEVENGFQAKKKLRSSKLSLDICDNAEQQVGSEVSNPSGMPVLAENETLIKPLRGKEVLQNEVQASDVGLQEKQNVTFIDDSKANINDSCLISDKPIRMPLRSERNKAEMSTESPPMENRKLALRSQRFAAPSTSHTTAEGQRDISLTNRIKPERIAKEHVRHFPLSANSMSSQSSVFPVSGSRTEPQKHTAQKFLEVLNKEENQHLIANLNVKYDKMQKGWVQMDKEGQSAVRHKNKADRQAAIWKSKRRTRKPKSPEHQKYSPVQMLFMKKFDLGSICRWFLESTETKSLVIVKKVNTRLPSETQLCFHSSSGISGTSQGVFPSLQAERLKKHLKKFAIASPVKSNPKSQKLIAKALEQEANLVKGKEQKDNASATQTLTNTSSFAELNVQIGESQKVSGKSKNPASARILRKYSNIREKMHVQQTNVRLKGNSKKMKARNMKSLSTKHPKSNLNSSLKAQKSSLPVQQKKRSNMKIGRVNPLAGKISTKHHVAEKTDKAQSSNAPSRDLTRGHETRKRCSQRLGCAEISEYNLVNTSTSKVDSTKKHPEEVEKSNISKASAGKIQTNKSTQNTVGDIRGTENAEIPQQCGEIKIPILPDQVLTRSQRKIEPLVPLSGSPSSASKKAPRLQNSSPETLKKAEKPILTRSGTKSIAKRSRAASIQSRSATPKLATKRAQELLVTPVKRTRTSLSK
ncbi:uncharacterized protein LOC143008935 isoform X1 [Genypterus blacodes]|uniref:uncharacterized protein LOC143008935 isoform X1 n=1 Tax=Genypterus blacodes TaxID=154954 RepID=UPI003F765C35